MVDHPVPDPGHVFHIQPDELGTTQRAGEAEEKQRPVAGACEIRPAGPAQLADLSRAFGSGSVLSTGPPQGLASDVKRQRAGKRVVGGVGDH
jgi:hypothetical protein